MPKPSLPIAVVPQSANALHLPNCKVLSIIPPMTQLNVPYPATAYLTGFLRSRGVVAVQEDLALALVLRLFSRQGLAAIKPMIEAMPRKQRSPFLQGFLTHFAHYSRTVEAAVAFLQGRDPSLAHRIASRTFLPEGPRFDALDAYVDPNGDDPLAWAFGALGTHDRARHLATLYLDDVADVLREAVDPRFEFVRYGESLAASQPSFTPLANALAAPPTLVDTVLAELTLAAIAKHQPTFLILSAPFPGSVYGGFCIAKTVKAAYPEIKIALGGGFVNTELRELAEPRVFDYVDYVMLDDGEAPLLAVLKHLYLDAPESHLCRTFVRNAAGEVVYINAPQPDVPFAEVGTPTWDGLPLDRYLAVLDMLNPMHRLWSESRWNKLTVAHGCYWKKCSFCDVSLDYIGRYEAAQASVLVDRIERIMDETGQTGFHFVDEAAPPKVLHALADELAKRQLSISWWGNIRFEKSFTPDLCQALAESGCIAVSGGLEVASDRLLKLMQKGVSVEQVARVTHSFSDAGILVHAYLMYGFPSQTVQDTVDALDYVRQLFAAGCIQSGFFHRFACTVHSPVGLNPEAYGIRLQAPRFQGFAKNDVRFSDPTNTDHTTLGLGLTKALYNYMHGIGLDDDVRIWFENQHVPRSKVPKHFIERALMGGG